MYRRLASTMIFALGFLFSVSARPAADRSVAAGLEFRFSDGGTVIITGYTGIARTLAIPSQIQGSPVTGIGDSAFIGNSNLTGVTIPSSVTSIGNSAFLRTGLTSITIPSSVVSIGDDAFRTTRLTNIAIPSSVRSIGARALSDNAVLTGITVDIGNPAYTGIEGVLFDKNVQTLFQYPGAREGNLYTIPLSVSAIEERAFTGNRNLTDVTIPPSVVSIGNFAFSNTGLTSVTIPQYVISIGDRAFDGASLTGIVVNAQNPAYADTDGVLFDKNMQTLLQYPLGRLENTYLIPSSVISIGDRAFSNNRNLTGVTIPSSVTSIGNSAFNSTGLTSVTIPASVVSIGNSAFSSTALTNVTIPPSVTSIGNSAFSSTGLTSVTIPASVVSIGNFVFDSINALSGIIVDAQNPIYTSIDGVLFDKSIQTLIKYPGGKQESSYTVPPSVSSIADRAFDNNRNLTSVTLPASVVSIGDRAFSNNRNLASIVLPPAVVSIGSRAFDSTSLTRITIPLSVTFIGNRAFADNSRLTAIDVDNGNTAYAGIDGVLFDKGIQTLLQYPGNKQESAYTIPPSVSSIADRAFAGNANLTNVTMPPSVISIGNSAFLRTGITSVAIPASVAFIGGSAFDGTNSLTSFNVNNGNHFYASSEGVLFDKSMQTLLQYPVSRQGSAYTVPPSVTFIGNRAFADSRNLTSITIPASVVSIGSSAFLRSALTGITIPQSVTSIGNSAFDDNAGLTSINMNAQNPVYASIDGVLFDKSLETLIRYPVARQGNTYIIPQSVKSIGNRAFAASAYLTDVTIPLSVVSIGNSAFLRVGLTSITIPASVLSIGGSAFDGTGLTSITIPPSVVSIGNSAFSRTRLTAVTLSRQTLVGRAAFPLGAVISYSD